MKPQEQKTKANEQRIKETKTDNQRKKQRQEHKTGVISCLILSGNVNVTVW